MIVRADVSRGLAFALTLPVHDDRMDILYEGSVCMRLRRLGEIVVNVLCKLCVLCTCSNRGL